LLFRYTGRPAAGREVSTITVKSIGTRLEALATGERRLTITRGTRGAVKLSSFHPMVFVGFLASMTIMLGSFVVLFWGQAYVEYMIVIGIGFFVIYCGLPLLMLRREMAGWPSFSVFLYRKMEVWTGKIAGREALFQVCLIPMMLALATLCICGVILMMRV
jgi:hypothetical protein